MTGSPFDLFMRDPADWFEEAARLARLHHDKLAGQGVEAQVHKEAAGASAPCAVIRLDSRRKP